MPQGAFKVQCISVIVLDIMNCSGPAMCPVTLSWAIATILPNEARDGM
jgi:hypothetical protein